MLEEIVSEFLLESYEGLDQLDRDLMALEESPGDRDRLSSIFRAIHTIKGTSGFLAFPTLERVTHVGESLLVPLRDGKLSLTNEITNALLAMVDAVRSILKNIETDSGEGDSQYPDLIARLESLKSGEPTATPPAEIAVEEVIEELSPSPAEEVLTPEPQEELSPAAPKRRSPRKKAATSQSAAAGKTAAKKAPSKSTKATSPAEMTSEPAVVETTNTAVVKAQPPAVAEAPGEKSQSSGNGGASLAESSVRIDVHLLDKLMNLVGELVLARNQIMQLSVDSDDQRLMAASQRVNLITTELQEGVMKTRMQPIRNAWNKLPRVVRDLSQSCGKQVQVQMEGADTELDKTILEAIKDPLTHIVRNSVDHGIESADVRTSVGKPAEGTLLLRAYHEGGQVNIEITDDGGGINVERVRAKAVEKGLVNEQQAAAMSDRDASQLILLPGFSTAAQVTNVSGRGVGMDVVKTNVEKIGGTLDIQSRQGEGTTLRIKIPLTLAIIPALVVTCHEGRYCIPQVSLLELVRLEGGGVTSEIELLHSVPVYRLRGQLLPLIYLDEELGLRSTRTDKERATDSAVNIVVLQAEDRQFGLVVDAINDTQEIVVKPLGEHLKKLDTYAGSTIMGDGTVSLILDVIGIARQGHVVNEHVTKTLVEANKREVEHSSDLDSYLIVAPQDDSRAAIRLSTVARLEEIDANSIERDGHQQVVQYRDEIMPLVSLAEYGQVDATDGKVSLVVYNANGKNVGVVVGRIVDIVKHAESDNKETQIIEGRVTRIVDLSLVTAC